MSMKLGEIARMLGGDIVKPRGADGLDIVGVAGIEAAGPGEITFVGAPQYERFLATTRAAAVLVTPDLARQRTEVAGDDDSALLQVADPYRAFMRLLGAFGSPNEGLPPGVHATAIVP